MFLTSGRYNHVFARMHHLQMNKEHAAQEELLQALLGREPFVASYVAYSLNMGNYPKKFASLAEIEVGENTLLPEVNKLLIHLSE